MGFVPADHPRAVILVLIDEPSTSSYGGVVAAPVFRNIASGVMQALRVTPERAPQPATDGPRVQQAKGKGKDQAAAKVKPARAQPAPPPPPPPAGARGRGASRGRHDRRARHAELSRPLAARGADARTRRRLDRRHATAPAGSPSSIRVPGAPLGDDRRLALELRPDRPSAQP